MVILWVFNYSSIQQLARITQTELPSCLKIDKQLDIDHTKVS